MNMMRILAAAANCFRSSVKRPWGEYKTLWTTNKFQIKVITVYPNSKSSLQSHKKRNEYWIPVKGAGYYVLGDGMSLPILTSKIPFIPANAKHRVENKSDANFVFIEVQTGTYFGEDDITRYEDEYGRV